MNCKAANLQFVQAGFLALDTCHFRFVSLHEGFKLNGRRTAMNSSRFALRIAIFLAILFATLQSPLARHVHAEQLELPPGTGVILNKIYSFDLDAAIADSQRMQTDLPKHPLGYLLEAEARWWEIWCQAADFKYGMTDARRRQKVPADQRYLDLSETAASLAESRLKQSEAAEMHFYAGLAGAFAARLYGLRGENRATARAGVKARVHFQRALQLDPSLADADFGLGLYNYYVDTLSGIIKFLSFFMGIPGGNKQEGIRQLQHVIADGVLTPDAARFYLALDLHRYDQRYEQALTLITPLVERFPSNPLFQLALGDLYGKLGRKEQAVAHYRAAASLAITDETCRARVHELVRASLAAQGVADTSASH